MKKEPNGGKGTQCFECGGYGHIRSECPNFLRRPKKGLNITWSDSESECEKDVSNVVMAYPERYEFEYEFIYEELTKELIATYKLVLTKWEESCLTTVNQKKFIDTFKK